jgi:hypothetical protein
MLVKLFRLKPLAVASAAVLLAGAAAALSGSSASAATITPTVQHAAPAAQPVSGASAVPASASGCAGSTVCIEVGGSGLEVNSVAGGVAPSGGAAASHTWCGYVWVTGTLNGATYLDLNSASGCATSLSPYDVAWTLNEDFPNGMKICLGQDTDSGYYNPGGPACETVEG